MNDNETTVSERNAMVSTGHLAESEPSNGQAGAMIRVEDDYGIAVWDSKAPPVMASFDAESPEGTQKASQMMVAADRRTRNVAGQSIAVVDYLVHGVRLTNKETGEITPRLRVVLRCDDETTVSIMSEPCVKALAFIFRNRKRGPFNPPVYIAFKEVPTTDAQSYCVCWEIPAPKQTPPHRRGKQMED